MVSISEVGPSISDQDIIDLENLLEINLPGSYKKFLLEFNGGVPTPDLIDVPGLQGSPTDVQVFFGIGRSVLSSGLKWNFENFGKVTMKAVLFPIGCDSGGGVFAISINRDGQDEVLYFDPFDGDSRLYEVALCFDDFLGKIRGLS